MVSPVIEELAEENADKIKVCKINLDENMKVARRYAISAIPAVLLFKDGEELEDLRIIGARPKAAYQEAIGELIKPVAAD